MFDIKIQQQSYEYSVFWLDVDWEREGVVSCHRTYKKPQVVKDFSKR